MSNVTVHIDENLDVSAFHDVEHNIQALEGVNTVTGSDKHPHLMVVDYDHRNTNSQVILGALVGQGYHAELIGF
ncbi:MAG: ATP-binding protein [Gammaproteobacteria bacterium]|nr:ATP-binding protein [Gammaproteobacteria bacterium]